MNTLTSIIKSPKSTLGGIIALAGCASIWLGETETGVTLIGIGAALAGLVGRDNDRTDAESCADLAERERQVKRNMRKHRRGGNTMVGMFVVLALVAMFLVGCGYNLYPGADYIRHSGSFGEYQSKTEIALPKDTTGKLLLVEGPVIATELEATEAIAREAQRPTPAAPGRLSGVEGYTVYSPVLEKEHRAFRYLMIDYEASVNEELTRLTAEWMAAKSRNDTEAMAAISERITQAILKSVIPSVP